MEDYTAIVITNMLVFSQNVPYIWWSSQILIQKSMTSTS